MDKTRTTVDRNCLEESMGVRISPRPLKGEH